MCIYRPAPAACRQCFACHIFSGRQLLLKCYPYNRSILAKNKQSNFLPKSTLSIRTYQRFIAPRSLHKPSTCMSSKLNPPPAWRAQLRSSWREAARLFFPLRALRDSLPVQLVSGLPSRILKWNRPSVCCAAAAAVLRQILARVAWSRRNGAA